MSGVRRAIFRALFVAAVSGLAAVAAGCMPQPQTTEGTSIDNLYTVAFAMSIVVAVLVWGLLTFAIVRYRRGRRSTTELPPQTRGSLVLEVVWTAGPLLAILVLFGLTLLTLNTVNAAPQSDAVKLNVEGFRWGWRMSYPDDGVTVQGVLTPGPEAVLPVGREVVINLTAVDVIHSFFVPQFLYKRDAIPGHPTSFTITIQQPGTYAGQCAEFCGIFHAQMPFTIRAVSDADYQTWLSQQRAATTAPPAPGGPTSPAPAPGATP
jgi:cytochrome c oxidase subunit 2